MINKEIYDPSTDLGSQTADKMNGVLGIKGVKFHYTVSDGFYTYGGIFNEQSTAETVLIEMQEKPGLPTDLQEYGEVIFLEEGQRYRPWGSPGNYTHGENDGTHGSVKITKSKR